MNEEEHLLEHGIRPTAVRLLVWRKLCRTTQAFTLKDVEDMLPYTERSSIFRTLRLFSEHNLLHETDDGTGLCKYCVCRCEDSTHIGHVHFTCSKCNRTYCFVNQHIPMVTLPDGYHMQQAEYVIKGICPNCK